MFCYKIKIVFKDDVFLAFKANENLKGLYHDVQDSYDKMGLIVVTIKHLLFVLQQPILIGWD